MAGGFIVRRRRFNSDFGNESRLREFCTRHEGTGFSGLDCIIAQSIHERESTEIIETNANLPTWHRMKTGRATELIRHSIK
jgi:hypothetical protein